jgi:phage shock protein C
MSCYDDRREEKHRRRAEKRARRAERRAEWHGAERPYNPHRIYRDRENRKIMGVLAGLASYFGIDPLPLRVAAVIAAFLFPFPVIPGYFLAAFLLPKRPRELFNSPEEESLWREVTIAPDRSFQALNLKFRELEARLKQMEADVTSGEWELRRKFRDLGV